MNARLSPVACGLVCALANVVVISIGLSAIEPSMRFEVMTALFGLTFIPCGLVGAILGYVAGETAGARVGVRRAVLLAPAITIVYALGYAADMDEFIVASCVPTIVAALVLEKWTRHEAALPLAVVR